MRDRRLAHPRDRITRVLAIAGLIGLSLLIGAAAGCRVTADAGRSIAASRGIPYPARIAHRGASALAPEETRAAYVRARDLGADFLEGDVQRTRDGVLVLLHDEGLERTTDVTARYLPRRGPAAADTVGYWVGRFDWAEIESIDAGSWFDKMHPREAGGPYRGQRVLSLDQLLDIAEAIAPRPGVFLETKSALRYPGIERQLVERLRARGWIAARPADGPRPQANVLFESFVPLSLDSLRYLAPEVPRFLLTERGSPWRKSLDQAESLGAGWAPHALDLLAHPGSVREAHRRGMLVYPWVLDAPWQFALARLLGADGVFTNRIDIAVRSRRRKGD